MKNTSHVAMFEPKMNHDYAHCLDCKKDCPESCFRAQLTREVATNELLWNIPLSWMHFEGTKECPRRKK